MKISNETKARYFAQYYGQIYVYSNDFGTYKERVSFAFGHTDKRIPDATLLLRPISSLIDEEAIQIAKYAFDLTGHNYPLKDYRVIRGPKSFIVEIDNDWYMQAVRIGIEYCNVWRCTLIEHEASTQRVYNQIAIFQYLLKLGIAVPFESYSISDLVEAGVIKLIE